jgi:endonuclease YncB( thermonuclease family)
MEIYNYKGTVTKHYDGDTPTICVQLGWGLSFTSRVRMAGINAPEINSTNPVMKQKAFESLNYLESLIPIGSEVFIQGHIFDNYGRLLGTIYKSASDTVSINELMVENGMAAPMALDRQIQYILKGKYI